MVDRICHHCGKPFKVYPSEIRKGRGKFCSISCGTIYRNLTDNPATKEEVREKISKNHADVSGQNNPMYGRRGKDSPSYIDGRSNSGPYTTHGKIMAVSGIKKECAICSSTERIEVHHLDGVHKNNEPENLVYLCRKCHREKAHTYSRDSAGRFNSITTNDIREMIL